MKHLLSVALLLSLAPWAIAQQAQKMTQNDPPWENCGGSDDYNNNDAQASNGPVLGRGTGTQGDYMTWTWNGTQFRVLKSACTVEGQWDTWLALDGHHIEFIMADGVVTDVHDDV